MRHKLRNNVLSTIISVILKLIIIAYKSNENPYTQMVMLNNLKFMAWNYAKI